MEVTSAQTRAQPRIENLISATFEFDFARGGEIRHIKLFRCVNAKDQSEAKGVLTPEEEAMGIRIIASRRYYPNPEVIGKKRYDSILFDKRVRKYLD